MVLLVDHTTVLEDHDQSDDGADNGERRTSKREPISMLMLRSSDEEEYNTYDDEQNGKRD